ncbi:MAG: DNA adenine methylase [Burkholderiaceae bacterium]|nr:DNA adenine methylase [Burkholderiaceae bacterium]
MQKKHPAIRYHGAKFRLAPWIMSFFPDHQCYVEPFGGAAGVLLNKPRAYAEVYNDLDRQVVNFFEVLRNPITRARLIEAVVMTPYAREEFDAAWESSDCPIENARRLAIRAQMGFGSAGATKGSTGFRVDTKRDYGTAQDSWVQYPNALATAGKRFAGVLIENRPAVEVMQSHDAPTTLHFVDPPYVFSTRKMKKSGCYQHEMSDADHLNLIETLLNLKGFVVLSGYPSDLYQSRLAGWEKFETASRISSARGTALRTECVWINPQCSDALANKQLYQQRMFA